MHYLVTIGFETEQEDKHGNIIKPKVQKSKCIIEAESVEEATIISNKYASEDTRNSECLSIIKTKIDSIINPKITPKYYKS
jgi:hypothetical protein